MTYVYPPIEPQKFITSKIYIDEYYSLTDLLKQLSSFDNWMIEKDHYNNVYLIKTEDNPNYEQEKIEYDLKMKQYQKAQKKFHKKLNTEIVLRNLGLSEEKIKNLSEKQKKDLIEKFKKELP